MSFGRAFPKPQPVFGEAASRFRKRGVGFSPSSLFTGGALGFWYDPGDTANMWQDINGTTTTGANLPVGLIKDKSRAETVKRTTLPVMTVSASVSQNGNVLTFNNSPANDQASANGVIAVQAFYRMSLVVEGTGSVVVFCGGSPRTFSAGTHLLREWFSANSVFFIFRANTGGFNGTVTFVELRERLGAPLSQATAGNKPTLRNAGGLAYLEFDGSNDFLSLGAALALTATDTFTIVAGVRKSADTADAIIAEFSANADTTAGTFALHGPYSASNTYRFTTGGTTSVNADASGFAAPVSSVVTGIADISTDTALLRVNGVQVGTSAGDQGTGNFTSQTLYVGARSGGTLPFAGNLYGLFGINRVLTAAELRQVEAYMASRTGVVL